MSGRRGLIVCWLDGGGNSGVGRDWCGWVSGTLCALGSRPSFCIWMSTYTERWMHKLMMSSVKRALNIMIDSIANVRKRYFVNYSFLGNSPASEF